MTHAEYRALFDRAQADCEAEVCAARKLRGHSMRADIRAAREKAQTAQDQAWKRFLKETETAGFYGHDSYPTYDHECEPIEGDV